MHQPGMEGILVKIEMNAAEPSPFQPSSSLNKTVCSVVFGLKKKNGMGEGGAG